MPAKPSLDIPSDLSPEDRQRLTQLCIESTPRQAPLEVCEYLIRHWCEAFEDGNPLYLDADYARSRGFGDLVAPPLSLMSTFSLEYRWPRLPGSPKPQRNIHYDVKEILGLVSAIVTDVETEHYEAVQVGDRLQLSQRLVSLQPHTTKRFGSGYRWVTERLYRNRQGALLATQRLTAFGYGRSETNTRSSPGPAEAANPMVEHAIEAGKTGYSTAASLPRFWDDVTEGEALPAIVMPINLTRLIYAASATRDFAPMHSNPEQAPGGQVFANTWFLSGMVSRLVTAWAGAESRIRRTKLSMIRKVCSGDEITVSGAVRRRYLENDCPLVEAEVSIVAGSRVVAPGTVTVELPRRR